MSAKAELWRVSTIEGIFEADLETLRQWIVEGCVLPTDKVCKGTLGWIEAGKAPMLRTAFSGEYVPAAAPLPPAVDVPPPVVDVEPPPMVDTANEGSYEHVHEDFVAAAPANACYNHPELAPKLICRVCSTTFCEECPRYVGSTKIPVCPLCGDMCKPYEEVQKQVHQMNFQGSPFGMSDLGRALSYPLQHKMALLFGAAVYGFLQLAGFRGRVIAFVIMFGCISHVISQVAWGRLHRSFLPDFSAFSMWDDLAVPIGLGIGITIVTWGPAIVLVLVVVFGVVAPVVRPAPAASAPQSAALTQEDLAILADPEADPKKLEAANAKLNAARPGSYIAKEAEESKKKLNDPTADLKMLMSYVKLSIFLVLLFDASVLWGLFYGPMALCVAGYTEQFSSVVNPLVGLDTIRRMGRTYFKAFGMVLGLQIVGFIISVIVAVVTSPFAMPFFGNLPANFIDGMVTFYFNLVIACVLGLSLHKSADRLGIDLN